MEDLSYFLDRELLDRNYYEKMIRPQRTAKFERKLLREAEEVETEEWWRVQFLDGIFETNLDEGTVRKVKVKQNGESSKEKLISHYQQVHPDDLSREQAELRFRYDIGPGWWKRIERGDGLTIQDQEAFLSDWKAEYLDQYFDRGEELRDEAAKASEYSSIIMKAARAVNMPRDKELPVSGGLRRLESYKEHLSFVESDLEQYLHQRSSELREESEEVIESLDSYAQDPVIRELLAVYSTVRTEMAKTEKAISPLQESRSSISGEYSSMVD